MGEFRARTTPICCTGVVAAACTQGKRTQHGKPRRVIWDDQPDAHEGQAGRAGVAERLAVPLKPGNAGGGKGPQFKTGLRMAPGRSTFADDARSLRPSQHSTPREGEEGAGVLAPISPCC